MALKFFLARQGSSEVYSIAHKKKENNNLNLICLLSVVFLQKLLIELMHWLFRVIKPQAKSSS